MSAFIMLLIVFFCCIKSEAFAGEEDSSFAYDYVKEYEASGAGNLYEELPEYASGALDEAGIHSDDISSLTELQVGDVLNSVVLMASDEIQSPLSALGVIIALLLLSSVFRCGTSESPLSLPLSSIISLSVMLTFIYPTASLLDSAGDAVDAACRFTLSFGTVFAGILAANGQTVSAAGFSAFLSGATGAEAIGVNEVIMPMLRIFLALSCASSVSDSVRIDAAVRFFEKYAKWLLCFAAVIITASLSLSGLLASSADSVASRTAKFVISGSVPVIGGAMSDAYLSIKSGMTLVRNSAGAFGIIGTAYVFLPIIIRTVLWNIVAGIGSAVCETLHLENENKLFRSMCSLLSILLGVLIFSVFLLTLGGILTIMRAQT
jgi:Stage III sporulation protein AE (spore_III_AE).